MATTRAPLLRRSWAIERTSAPSPPYWPSTMRWSCTDAATRSSRSSSRIVAIPGPLPVRELMTARAFAVPGPQMPSTSRPQLRWKSSSARAVSGPKMRVDPSAVEAELAEQRLQRADVIATQVRSEQLQRPVTESPRCLDEGEPRRLVAGAVIVQSAVALERLDGGDGRRIERTGLGSDRGEPGAPEATLQVANRLAVLSRDQGTETRNSSSSCSSWVLPRAPMTRLLRLPLEKTSSVGMLCTP